MLFKFFVVPIMANEEAAEEMNRFPRGQRDLAVKKRFMKGREKRMFHFNW